MLSNNIRPGHNIIENAHWPPAPGGVLSPQCEAGSASTGAREQGVSFLERVVSARACRWREVTVHPASSARPMRAYRGTRRLKWRTGA